MCCLSCLLPQFVYISVGANMLLFVILLEKCGFCNLKVPITPKYFFRLNKSLHLFETHCAFLPLFNPNIDLLQAVKVTKSGHHLSHDRASKGYGSTPCLTSQTSLHARLQRLNTMQISLWRQTRNRPMPLLARSCDRWWLDFVTFTA